MSESQSYEYTPNKDGKKIYLKGLEYTEINIPVTSEVWNEKTNRWNNVYMDKIGFGHREHYHDFEIEKQDIVQNI